MGGLTGRYTSIAHTRRTPRKVFLRTIPMREIEARFGAIVERTVSGDFRLSGSAPAGGLDFRITIRAFEFCIGVVLFAVLALGTPFIKVFTLGLMFGKTILFFKGLPVPVHAGFSIAVEFAADLVLIVQG